MQVLNPTFTRSSNWRQYQVPQIAGRSGKGALRSKLLTCPLSNTGCAPQPLTVLTEDEKSQSTVRKFAHERVRPYVREMTRPPVPQRNHPAVFRVGLMGIEIPEEYGGQRKFLPGHPGSGGRRPRSSWTQNTICNNALLKWPSRSRRRGTGGEHGGRAALRAGHPTPSPRPCAEDAAPSCSPAASWITNAAEAGFFLLQPNPASEAGGHGVLVSADFRLSERRKSSGARLRELILDNRRVPRENVMGEVAATNRDQTPGMRPDRNRRDDRPGAGRWTTP